MIGLVEDTSPDALHDKDVLHDLVQYDSLKSVTSSLVVPAHSCLLTRCYRYSFIGPLFGSMSWNQTVRGTP